jgi:hypothetical protein
MLHGVLNMPPELWSGSPIDVMQRHSRYVQASQYIAELTEQRDGLQSDIDYASDQLHKVTEQRDELKAWQESAFAVEEEWDAQSIGTLLGMHLGQSIRANIEPKIRELIEQRDRLAVAMRQMWKFIKEHEHRSCNTPEYNVAILKYREALQSLTTNEQ